jgi:hypothetical protein
MKKLINTLGTLLVAIISELYPDPEHDTHWEREKVKFLREGFRSGYSLHKMYVEIKKMQEKYKKLNDAAT